MVIGFIGLCGVANAAPYGRPLYGPLDWSILYCRFTDSPTPARSITDFNAMLMSNPAIASADGYASFYLEASSSMITPNFHSASAWVTIPHDLAWANARANPARRMEIFDACVAAAQASGTTIPPTNFLGVVTTPGIQTTGIWGRALLGIEMQVSGVLHEMGHGMGFGHSYSERPDHTPAMGDTHVEYGDPFDIMSVNLVFWTMGSWGVTGPRMNSFNLDRMGWLARDETVNFGADGRTQATYTLTPLYRASPGGVRVVRIPFDENDPFHYYAVEMRKMEGLDAAFATHRVLIYEVKRLPAAGYLQGFLLRNGSLGDAIQSLNANGVTIAINAIAQNGESASVTITGDIATKCVPGFVHRAAGPNDPVCVLPSSRDLAQEENLNAPRAAVGGWLWWRFRFCPSPRVLRRAFAGDDVCVDPPRASEVLIENRTAGEHNAARAFRGLNACAPAYVWREATQRDYVCVTQQTHDESQEENDLAATRRDMLPFTHGHYLCKAGFVIRNAVPGDAVCAPPTSRARAIQDNAASASRFAVP